MTNVLFDRQSLKVTGSNRSPLPFEIEVKNVDATNLTKQVTYIETVDKEIDGKKIYLLPQDDAIDRQIVTKTIETTEETDKPVMVKVTSQQPLLGDDGKQIEYQPTILGETIEAKDVQGNDNEPVFENVYNEETGDVTQVQKEDENGNLIYLGQIPNGPVVKCFIGVEIDQQKEVNGQKIFLKDIEEEEITSTPQLPLEITEDDEKWPLVDTDENDPNVMKVEYQVEVVDDQGNSTFETRVKFVKKVELETVKDTVEKTKIVSIEEAQGEFDFNDIIALKEKQIINGTFYDKAKIYAQFDDTVFSTYLATYKADLAAHVVSLPAGGEVRTTKLSLPKAASAVGVKIETNISGLDVKVGAVASDLQLIDRTTNERLFNDNVTDVYVSFTNTTDERIDLFSFALLV
jgi:hypothetical protein